tara:strand:- start:1313 stop:1528 length:216 start_codon:yes stop_codon:yes gene_type:complete
VRIFEVKGKELLLRWSLICDVLFSNKAVDSLVKGLQNALIAFSFSSFYKIISPKRNLIGNRKNPFQITNII